MVRPNFNGLFRPLKFGPLLFERFYDSEKLFIVNFVIAFGRGIFRRKVGNGPANAVLSNL
jgi:hypothetical protein